MSIRAQSYVIRAQKEQARETGNQWKAQENMSPLESAGKNVILTGVNQVSESYHLFQ